jgi:non-ribosomal peptide synthase protein (TIGR01720 family)
VDTSLLEAAVGQLLRHHDALRLRFSHTPAGWQQVNTGVDEAVPFASIDVSMVPPEAQSVAVAAAAAALQASLDLTWGPLLRVAYLHLGDQQAGRLLIVIHHLAVDGVSWRILLEDLHVAYQQLSRHEPVQLPPKTTSVQHWSQRLVAYAQSATLRQELAYWLEASTARVDRLPIDYAGGMNDEASAETVAVLLRPDETQTLLQAVPAAYRTQINDVLLTALVKAFSRWTGKRALLVDLEGHGREEVLEGIDLSRTVGWFTTIFPVLLDLGKTLGPGEALQVIKEQLRRIPNRGIGYGLLRYLCEDTEFTAPLRALPQAEVSFNYFGQLDQAVPQSTPFVPARESRGLERSALGTRSYVLDVIGSVRGGRLQLRWVYSNNLHRRKTIENLAQGFLEELRLLISHCTAPEAGGYTPSDFALAKLNQEKLGRVLATIARSKQGY